MPECVMLDVELVGTPPMIPEKWAYVDPDDPWMNGVQDEHHVTLKYGLLPSVTMDDVARVMDGWISGSFFTTEFVEVFPGNDQYEVLVARPSFDESYALRDANHRLSTLPHVDTWPVYKPHATLAYLQKGRSESILWGLNRLEGRYVLNDPLEFRVEGLSYT